MILSSLAALVLAFPTATAPINVAPAVAVTPHHQADSRISITLANDSNSFRDVRIAGHRYEILAHQALDVKAPAGTAIYAASRTPKFQRGDLMLALEPEMNKHTITVR